VSWRDIVKAKELTPKQEKLDTNHNGVIDGQDFHIINGAEKKSCGPNCNCKKCGDMEKFGGQKEQCPTCGNMFANQRVLDRHEQEKHSGSRKGSAFTAGE